MAGETENSIGTARAYLDIDTGDWDNAVARAKNSAAGLGSAAEDAFDQATGAQKKAATQLLQYVTALDKTNDQQKILNALMRGVPVEIAKAAAEAIDKQRQATAEAAAEQQRLNDEIAKQAAIDREVAAQQAMIEKARAEQNAANAQEHYNKLLGVNTNTASPGRRADAEAAFAQLDLADTETAAQQTERIKAMVQASLARADAEKAVQTAARATADVNEAQAASYEALIAKQNKSMTQAAQAADNTKKNNAAIAAQRDELSKLAGQIDPVTAKLNKLDQLEKKLGDARKAGLVSNDDFKSLSGVLDESRKKLTETSSAFAGLNLNTAQARREYGFLLKDLLTGQWGRFTQTAGSLASNTGAMSLAFTAAGAAALVAVAALGTFVIAAFKGWEQEEKLRMSIIATGDAVGNNAKQLSQAADQVGSITGKYGDARKAIEDLSRTTMGGAGVGGLALSITETAKVTGESVDKIVKDFQELQGKPSETIAKLNEQYNFLTAAQYAQIQALEETGRTREASRMAEEAYTSAMHQRAQEVEDNAGWIVKSAHWVRDEWNKAWAALKDVGATQGLQARATDIENTIAQLTKDRVDRAGNLVRGANGEEIQKLQKELATIRQKQWDDAVKASQDQQNAADNQRSIAAQRALAQFADPKTKLDSAIKLANENRYRALVGVVDPAARARINAEADEQIRQAQDTYKSKEKKRAGSPTDAVNAIKRDADAQQAQIAQQTQFIQGQFQLRQISMEDYYAELKQLAQESGDVAVKAIEKEIAAERAHGASKEKILGLESQIATERQKTANKLSQLDIQEAEAQQKRADAILAYKEGLDAQLQALQRNLNAQVSRIGMGEHEYEVSQRLNEIYNQQADALARIDQQYAKDGDQIKRDAERNAVLDQTSQKIKAVTDAYGAMDARQQNIFNGMKSAFADFSYQASQLSDNFKSVWVDGLNSIGDAAARTATGVGTSFREIGRQIEATAIRVVTNAAVSKLIQMFASFFGGGSGAAASGAGDMLNGGSNYTGYGSLSTSWNAKGNAYDSSPDLTSMRNSILTGPTPFMFAKGAALGVAGEAGREAIMPLSKDSNGVLGVRSYGAGSGAPVVNVNIKGASSSPEVTSRKNDQGGVDIDVIFKQVDQFMAGGITDGTSMTSRALKARLGR